MAVQAHQIQEVDCKIDALDDQTVAAFLDDSVKDDPDVLDRIAPIAKRCCETLHPKGVYKVFNPAICTLPPDYTEPGIKLVGTMAVLHGEAVYDRMRRANHCVMVAVAVDTAENIQALRVLLVHDKEDFAAFDACLQAMGGRAEEVITEKVNDEAHSLGLHIDNLLQAGESDFPLDSNTQLLFYTQAERRLGFACEDDGSLNSENATLGVIGMYDASQRGRKRACARCRNREFCSIRAIGMNCHGRRGKFKKHDDAEAKLTA